MQTYDDIELIAQTLSGNDEAYAELIDRYKNAVYYHCFAIVREEDVAEDITQETFIAAYYSLKRYNKEYKLSTWLFKISTNKCLNYLKKKGKELSVDDQLFESIASSHPSPHADALYDELHAAVKSLKPKYRAAVSLHYWQGLDYADTALAMNAPLNSVRVWLLRAKAQLRKELS